VLPLYARLPETFKRTMPFLLASICFHEQWLRDTLPARHPLFSSYLFASGTLPTLKPFVITGCNRCPDTSLTATGIPPHLAITNELREAQRETQLMKEAVISKCDALPTEMCGVLRSQFSINGVVPLTIGDVSGLLNNAVDRMRKELHDALPSVPSAPAPLVDPSLDPRFHLWSWGGRMHMVSADWVFPSTDAKATWNLWHFGHVGEHIRPLRYLKKADLKDSSQVTLWSKTGQVMKLLAQLMVEMRLVQSIDEWRSCQRVTPLRHSTRRSCERWRR